jgi:hypothetical protein
MKFPILYEVFLHVEEYLTKRNLISDPLQCAIHGVINFATIDSYLL